jgi:radical SAM protein with 4Fe4S-binding SPASM domain
VVVLCGYGEPTLHSNLTAIVSALSGLRVEIVTNGDFLTPKSIEALSLAGVSFFAVSLYDGPHQIDDMRGRFERAGVAGYILRDRWHCAELDFGLRLTNRAGAVTVGNQKPVAIDRPCNYLAYQIVVDWNGDVLLCPQDWSKRVRFGNVNSGSLLATWHSSAMHKRRQMLLSGRRCLAPCDGCNADGTLHGANHVQDWCGDDNDAVGLGSNGQDRRRAAV